MKIIPIMDLTMTIKMIIMMITLMMMGDIVVDREGVVGMVVVVMVAVLGVICSICSGIKERYIEGSRYEVG